MRYFACIACLCCFLGANTSFAQGDCSSVVVANGVDFSYYKGGAVDTDLAPLNLDEDGDGIPDRANAPSSDAKGAPTLEWTLEDFDDTGWEVGPSGFGYGDQLDSLGTVLDDMEDSYVTVYLRHSFEIEDLALINSMAINIDYDDGFVAYINGVEVARRNVEGSPPAFNILAGTNHESNGVLEPIPLLDIDSLEEGENILAIQMHNTTLSSSDLIMQAELVANPETGGECPSGMVCSQDGITGEIMLSWTNQQGGYESIQVWRNGEMIEENIGGDQELYIDDNPVFGEIAYAIVAIDPAAVCAECSPVECSLIIFNEEDTLVAPGDEWNYFTGVEAGPDPEWITEDFDDFDWELGPTGIGYGDGDDATVLEDMSGNYVVVYARKVISLELVTLESLILSCAIDDGFVAYVNGEEVGRFNVADGEVNNDTTAITANPVGEPVVDSPVELSIAKDFLVEGNNVIAISIHNATLGSSDLTFIPTLIRIPTGKGGGPGPGPGTGDLFLRGDVDDNGFVNLTDAVALLLYLFQQGTEPSCLDSTDIDDNGFLNLTDGVSLLNHLFRAGAAPQPPGFLECGEDPTEDNLGDCTSSDCAEEG